MTPILILKIFLSLLIFIWLVRQIKSIFFWIYLWQLKEYHIGRFLDHFRTEKGKRIFLNPLFIVKIILFFYVLFLAFYPKLVFWGYYVFWIFLLFFLYFFETIKFLFDAFLKKIKTPVFTKKTLFLTLINISFLFLFLFIFYHSKRIFYVFWFSFWILFVDIFSAFLISTIIILFQPLTFFIKFLVIKKATNKREKNKNLLTIGITGSYGKTSTKEILATLLEEKFGKEKVLKTKEHQNSEMGISECILKELNENHQFFIVEMGAYNRGGIKLLTKIVKPKIAILTGVNEQHLSLFGSMENLISAEGGKELIENLPVDGLVIFNGENEILRKIYQETKKRKKIVGINKKDFDFWASNIKEKKDVLFFQIFSRNGEFADFNLHLIGKQNIENILLSIACAEELGMNLVEIARAVQKITPEQTGVKLFKTKSGFNIIDATYSANPNSVLSHLDYLKVWEGKKIVIMPCLIELGSASKEIHKKIGQKIGEICDLAIIITKERFNDIKLGAREKALFLEDPKKIFNKLKEFKGENDVFLLEGRLPKELIKLLFNYARN